MCAFKLVEQQKCSWILDYSINRNTHHSGLLKPGAAGETVRGLEATMTESKPDTGIAWHTDQLGY